MYLTLPSPDSFIFNTPFHVSPFKGETKGRSIYNKFMKSLKNVVELKERRKELRNNMTGAEMILWDEIKNKKMGVKFRRQYSFGNYILDFYCPDIKLVIEVDGEVHKGRKEIDSYRTRTLEEYGLKVKRIDNNEVVNNLDNTLNLLRNEIIQLVSPF